MNLYDIEIDQNYLSGYIMQSITYDTVIYLDVCNYHTGIFCSLQIKLFFTIIIQLLDVFFVFVRIDY